MVSLPYGMAQPAKRDLGNLVQSADWMWPSRNTTHKKFQSMA
jgi:hypothetical protein